MGYRPEDDADAERCRNREKVGKGEECQRVGPFDGLMAAEVSRGGAMTSAADPAPGEGGWCRELATEGGASSDLVVRAGANRAPPLHG